jgi:putative glutathione S-transferase
LQLLKPSVHLSRVTLTIDEENCRGVFEAMDRMDEILSKNKYLAGDKITEADVRAYTTAARFDVAYHGAFKCNIRQLRSYPNLNRWLKSIYWGDEYPEFKKTSDFDAVRSWHAFLTIV